MALGPQEADDVLYGHPNDFESSEWQPSFRTYSNYFRAWQMLFEDRYGLDVHSPLDAIIRHPRFGAIRTRSDVPPDVQNWLANAWSTEILLSMPLTLANGPGIARYANAWAPVQGYYAVFSGLNAVGIADGQAFRDHRAALNFASSVVRDRAWVPDVYCYRSEGVDRLSNVAFPTMPSSASYPISNLREPQSLDEALALVMTSLKTTRRAFHDARATELLRRQKTKAGKPRKNVRDADRRSIERNMPATTIFDFLYRVRIRCNYRESEPFIRGPWSDLEAAQFLAAIVSIVQYVLAFLETMIWRRMGRRSSEGLVRDYLDRTPLDSSRIPLAKRWGR